MATNTAKTTTTTTDPKVDLTRTVRSQEVAIAELGNLPSSRAVYQKKGNLFFRTTVQKATTSEKKQLDAAKSKLQKLTTP